MRHLLRRSLGSSSRAPLECVLARHPGVTSAVAPDCFRVQPLRAEAATAAAATAADLARGHVVVDTLCLSVDPYMRCRLDPAHPQLGEYIEAAALGEPFDGGGVGRVTASAHPAFAEGSLVCAPFTGFPWQTRAVLDAADSSINLTAVPAAVAAHRPSLVLGALGMPGLTSWFCMLHAGRPAPGDTVVVSAAAGACGSLAGQLAKKRAGAARVVGIAGSAAKCARLVGELGFDAAVCYRDGDFAAQLGVACPAGVDVYMDNVGGAVSDAVLRLANDGCRIPICGQIAHYDEDVPYSTLVSEQGVSPELRELLAARGAERGRFLVLDYAAQWEDALQQLGELVLGGELAAPETVTRGFDPGRAFCEMMGGANVGKAIVVLEDE